MPKGFSFNLTGLDAFDKRLKDLKSDVYKDTVAELSASTMRIEKDAKKQAPVNLGTLRQSIHAVSYAPLTHAVVSYASYAPYVEFGTGGKVSVPPGYEDFALQYKGLPGGTYYDFLMAIAEWVRRKGIKPNEATYNTTTRRRSGTKAQKFDQDVRMAQAIAFSILKKGIRPQPFMIPAYEAEKPVLIERLKKILNAKS
jgi:HK97 gp10 family phage protein